MNKNRPNTGVDDKLLSNHVILCCGEDSRELLGATNSAGFGNPIAHHEYRCYRFWRYPECTVIWTGIGSGCLEPLLYEILRESLVENICLIGTAGMSRAREGLVKGHIYRISAAQPWAAAVRPVNQRPLTPNWPIIKTGILDATIVSTDYYYGLSRIDNSALQKLRSMDAAFLNDYFQALDSVDLVDMEVAQFYFLCEIYGRATLRWIALKGPANSLDDFSEQTIHSHSILEKAMIQAGALLEIKNQKP